MTVRRPSRTVHRPNAGLVAWSRPGSSYAPADLAAALECRALLGLRVDAAHHDVSSPRP